MIDVHGNAGGESLRRRQGLETRLERRELSPRRGQDTPGVPSESGGCGRTGGGRGVGGMLAEVEGLVGGTIVSNPLRGTVPSFKVFFARAVRGLRDTALDDGVEPASELHGDVGALGVSGLIDEVLELVDVFLEGPATLVVTGGLQLEHSGLAFPIRKEAAPELGREVVPGLEVWVPGAPEDHVRVLLSSILLEEGEAPEDFGLLVREVVRTELEVDGARVEECATVLAVSVEDWGRGGLQTGPQSGVVSTRGVLGGFRAFRFAFRSRFGCRGTGCSEE